MRTGHEDGQFGGISRRGFIAGTLGAVAWLPARRVSAAECTSPPPPNFPTGIELYRQEYRNWTSEIATDDLWTCAPHTPNDVVTLANWAVENGWKLRPRGFKHGTSPLTVTNATACDARVVLVDTTRHLSEAHIQPGPPASVRAQCGVTLDALLELVEQAGYGLAAHAAIGSVSLGGLPTIGAHGTGVPTTSAPRLPGQGYGTLSNLLLSLTACVWDDPSQRYVLRTFDRSEDDCRALLAHLGRAFITEARLQLGSDYRLRCVSHVDIPASELFADPGSPGTPRTFASFVEDAGRANAIWFAFTDKPWLKVWTVQPTKPLLSREVTGPYNYPFTNIVPEPVSTLANRVISGEPWLAPLLGQAFYNAVALGLTATLSADIWGHAKDLMLYVKPSTMRWTENGYAVLTRRADLQRVISEFTTDYSRRLARYQQSDRYPINGAIDLRVTGLDQQSDVEVETSGPPSLSPVRPRPDQPDWEVAVWLGVLTFPGTPYSAQFYRETQDFIYGNFTGSYADVRVEWSKGWAYTDDGAFRNQAELTTTIPDSYRRGQSPDDNWDWTLDRLNHYDPHRIFTNEFMDNLLP